MHAERFLRKAVEAAGLELSDSPSPRYTLSIGPGEAGNYVSCELYDGVRGTTVWKGLLPHTLPKQGAGTKSQRAAFSRAFRDGIFKGLGE